MPQKVIDRTQQFENVVSKKDQNRVSSLVSSRASRFVSSIVDSCRSMLSRRPKRNVVNRRGAHRHVASELLEVRALLAGAPTAHELEDFSNFSDDAVSELSVAGSSIFFTVDASNSGGRQEQLWFSDGTAAGTVMVDDFSNFSDDAVSELTVAGSSIFFTVDASNSGGRQEQLWFSDGTAAGTVMVDDFSNFSDDAVSELSVAGSSIFFTVDASNSGGRQEQLWFSDGTAAGTVMVDDFSNFSDDAVSELTVAGSSIFFTVDDSNSGGRQEQLWFSDGTAAGTVMVDDFSNFSDDAVSELTVAGSSIFFTVDASNSGGRQEQLWFSDGTAAGTVMADDFSNFSDDAVSELTVAGSSIFFTVDDSNSGGRQEQLWFSDGSAAGTEMVDDFSQFPDDAVSELTVAGSSIFFTIDDSSSGGRQEQLWFSDGTAGGTVLMDDFSQFPDDAVSELTVAGSSIFFTIDDSSSGGRQEQLWFSDGTAGGTVLMDDFSQFPDDAVSELTVAGSSIFFTVDDSNSGGRQEQLWFSDGSAAGTEMVDDFSQFPDDAVSELTVAGSSIFFTIDDSSSGGRQEQLWFSDGTAGGTVLMDDFSQFPDDAVSELTVAGSSIFFTIDDSSSGGRQEQLWGTNGAPEILSSGSTGAELDSDDQQFTWSVVDAGPLTVTAKLQKHDGSVFQDVPGFSATTTTGSFDLNSEGVGDFRLEVTATDAFNATTTETRDVTVTDDDVQVPTITLGGSSGQEVNTDTQAFDWDVFDASGLASLSITITQDTGSGPAPIHSSTNVADAVSSFNFDSFGLGTFALTVTATDGDNDWVGDSSTDTATRTVNVVDAPDVDAGVDQNVAEGDSVSLSASVVDTDPGDSHTYLWTVSASNGQSVANGTASTFGFVPNDNGTYTVTATATDSYGETGTDTVVVNVSNAVPIFSDFALTSSVDEGGTATLSGTLADAGTADTFTITVNWGEGLPEAFNIPANGAGTQTVELTHVYDDDDLSNAMSDDFSVSIVSIVDDDAGAAVGLPVATDVTVNNTVPTIDSVTNDGPVSPSANVIVSIAASDLGGADDPLLYEYDFDNDNLFEIGPTSSSTATHSYSGTGTFPVNVRVTDDDGGSTVDTTSVVVAPSVTFTTAAQSLDEAAGTAVIAAQFATTAGSDVVVPLTISGTATDGSDFVLPGLSLTIPGGSDTGTFTIDITDDLLNEVAETIVVTMDQDTGSSPGAIFEHTITINDNDPLPLLSFSTAHQTVSESGGTVNLTARLNTPSGRDVTVPLQFSGSAANPSDYSVTPGPSITIPAGQSNASIDVNVVDDIDGEPTELIIVQMQASAEATLSNLPGDPVVHTITIPANDEPSIGFTSTYKRVSEDAGVVTATVQLSNPSSTPVTVDLNVGGTATSPSDYTLSPNVTSITIAPGDTEATIDINVVDDNIGEGDDIESVLLTLSNPVGAQLGNTDRFMAAIDDDDIVRVKFTQHFTVWEDVGTLHYTAELSNPSVATVTVPLIFSGSADFGSDYTTSGSDIVFAPGETSVTRALTIVDDTLNEHKEAGFDQAAERIYVTMGSVAGAVVENRRGYFQVFLQDDDPLVSISDDNQSTSEDTFGFRNHNISLSSITNKDVVVPIAYSGTAIKGVDYTVSGGSTLTIPAGHTGASIQYSLIDDSLVESAETATIRLSTPTNGVLNAKRRQRTITILDNDAFPLAYFSSPSWTLTEGASNFTVTVDLTFSPTAVTVPINFGGTASLGSDYTVTGLSNNKLTIPAGVRTASFTVRIKEDSRVEPTEKILITMGKVINATAYSTAPVRFTIKNDDSPPVPPKQKKQPKVEDIVAGTIAVDDEISSDVGPVELGNFSDLDGETTASDDANSYSPGQLAIQGEDGFLAGSTAFFDANFNRVLDFLDLNQNGAQDPDEPEEPSSITTGDGFASLTIDSAFDVDDSGLIEVDEGQLVVQGGFDTATELPLATTFVAPAGIFAATPISTLVASLMQLSGQSTADATARILEGLNLPDTLNLATLSSSHGTTDGNTDAALAFAANARVYNTVVQIGGLFSGTLGAPPLDFFADAAMSDIAAKLQTAGSEIDFGESFVIESIINGVVVATGVNLSSGDVTGAAQAIAAGNQAIDDISVTTDVAYLEAVTRVQVVAQGSVSARLAQVSAGGDTIANVVTDFTGANLDAAIAAAQIGIVIPPAITIQHVATAEGDAGTQLYDFIVNLNGASSREVTVEYQTLDSSATEADNDYVGDTGTLTWAAGDNSTRSIQVIVNGDTDFEFDEAFFVNLFNAQNAVIRRDFAYGYILGDDVLGHTAADDTSENTIRLVPGEDDLLLIENDVLVANGPLFDPTGFVIGGQDNIDDTFQLDFSSGVLPVGVITFHGGAAGFDTAEIDGGDFDVITQRLTNATDGQTMLDPADSDDMVTLNWTGLEPFLVDVGSVGSLIFELPAGVTSAILEDADVTDTTNPGMMQLRSPDGHFETTMFTNPSGSLTIRGGDGTATITIASLDPAFAGALTIDPDALGADEVNVTVDATIDATADVTIEATNITVNQPITLDDYDVHLAASGALVLNADLASINCSLNLSSGNPVVLNNELSGSVSLLSGEFQVVFGGSLNGSTFVNPTATLSGIGTGNNHGSVTVSGGTLAPRSNGPGSMNVGSVQFGTNSVFEVDLDGTAAGEFDQLRAANSIGLSGATLNVDLGFTPAIGNRFDIIDAEFLDFPPSGHFTGLPNGTIFEAGGSVFRITYGQGDGDGKNVFLTVVPPVTIESTTPTLDDGVLPAGTTELTVNFSRDVDDSLGTAPFTLQSVGPDGLLGSADNPGDDDIVSITSATYSGNSVTLAFAALPESVYRLTVDDTLTGVGGDAIDGDADGTAGRDYENDFVVGALTHTLTSPNGFDFDVEFGAFGAGQLGQGTSNAFDGLNRLQLDNMAVESNSHTSASVASGGYSESQISISGSDVPEGYTTVASVTTTVDDTKTGDYIFTFNAAASGGSTPRIRYLVDGVPSETTIVGGLRGDALAFADDGFVGLDLTRAISLTPGTHVVQVQIWNDSTSSTLNIRNPSLELIGFSSINDQAAASVQSTHDTDSISIPTTFTDVASLSTTVDASSTGDYIFSFGASVVGGSHTFVRYLIDGVPSPASTSTSGLNADALTRTNDGWATLDLTRHLQLTAGTHTITIQARTDSGTVDLRNSSLQLIGINKVDGQAAATVESIEQISSEVTIPTASGFTTVSSLTTNVDAAKTGEYLLTFGASAFAGSTAFVRYVVDGVPSAASTNVGGDTLVFTSDGWANLDLNEKLNLSPGSHTIEVQVSTDSGTLQIRNSYLQLVGFNAVAGIASASVASGGYSESEISISGSDVPEGYTTVASVTTTVDDTKTGDYIFTFNAAASGGSTPRIRYLVDGVPSETTIVGGLRGDALAFADDGFVGLDLTRAISLTPGTHVVQVQIWNDSTSSTLNIRNPSLELIGFSSINDQAAASVQSTHDTDSISIPTTFTDVASLSTTVDASSTGDYIFSFGASVVGGSHTFVRYLIDGVPSPASTTSTSGLNADALTRTNDGWATLDLTRHLQLTAGTHTITIQARTDNGTVDLRNSSLQLIGINKVDGQAAATVESIEQISSEVTIPTASGFTTVSSLTTNVDAAKTGEYLLTFGASAFAGSTAFVRYVVDGVPSAASTNVGGDTLVFTNDGWANLDLNEKLNLSPGSHTIEVQVSTDSGTIQLRNLYLQLVGFNAVAGIASGSVESGGYSESQISISGSDVPEGYTTVASVTTTVDDTKTGDYIFTFNAAASGGSTPRIRYLVDGVPSETTTVGGLRGDALVFANDGFVGLDLTRAISLTPGTHVVQVQIWNDAVSTPLSIRNPSLELVGFSSINGQAAATVQSTLETDITNVATVFTDVASLSTTVDASSTGDYIFSFGASVNGGSHTFVRYLIDGVPSPASSTSTSGLNADALTRTNDGWATLDLTRHLQLTAGTHTITIQARTDSGTVDLRNSSLQLIGINKVDGQAAATVESIEQISSEVTIPTASGFTTVSSLTTNVDAAKTGEYLLTFGASAFAGSTAFVRYVVDGVPSAASTNVGGDTLVFTNDGWANLDLNEKLNLSPGSHTIEVQVSTDSGTIQLRNLYLQLVGFNAVANLNDTERTVITVESVVTGLRHHREVTVPSSGSEDFARTIEVLENPTGSDISTTVRIVGNLGSDGATEVFSTSSGDTTVDIADQWIGTDDADGNGTPAIIHYVHGPGGLKPTAVEVIDDNIYWTYDVTVPAGETLRLATFTILADTRAEAESAAAALITTSGFGGQAAAFLTQSELDSLANFNFATDYGDAPDLAAGTANGDYETLADNDGPGHNIDANIFIGAAPPDADTDGFGDGIDANGDATDDDTEGATPDDDDGLVDATGDLTLQVGQTPTVDVTVTNNTGSEATLFGWIDYNSNGLFEVSESAFATVVDATTGATARLTFPQVPAGFTGGTFARFRLTTDATITTWTSGGVASDGEVEDYATTISLPTVELSADVTAGFETGETIVTITATSSAPVIGNQTVSVAASGTGVTPADYTLSETQITIPDGQTTGTVTFTVANDGTVEALETATLSISSPSAGIILGTMVSQDITITDNDSAAFTVDDVTVNEADGTATLTVSLDYPVDIPIVVDAVFIGDTATGGGIDFDSSPTSVEFPAEGALTGQVTVPIVNDGVLEASEQFTVTLSSQTDLDGRSVTVSDTATVAITDSGNSVPPEAGFDFLTVSSNLADENDPAFRFFGSPNPDHRPFTIIRYGEGTMNNIVSLPGLSSLVSSFGDLTFSFGSDDPGNPVEVVTLSSFDDGLTDGLANQIYTPDGVDDDPTLTVFHQGTPVATGVLVTVSLQTSPALEVTSPQTAPSQFQITSAVGADTSFFDEMMAATGGTGLFDFTLNAFALSGPWAGVADAEIFVSTGTLLNLVTPPPNVELSVSGSTATEADATVVTITATAEIPVSGDQTVDLTVAGTGITTGDYLLSNAQITILDGQTFGSVTLTVQNDVIVEDTETATLSLANPSSGLRLGTTISQDVAIADNDVAAPLNVAATNTATPRPTIVWDAAADATSYGIWFIKLAEGATPGGVVAGQSGLTSLSFTPNADLAEGNYSVWVRSINSLGVSGWSVPATFRIGAAIAIPDAPTSVSVVDETVVRPTIQWTASSVATSYGIWFINLAGGVVAGESNLTDSSFTSPTDLAVGSYKVWVRAFNSEGVSTWSTPLTFQAGPSVTIPDVPLNVTAINTETNRPTVQWDAVPDATSYGIWFTNVAGGVVAGESNLTGTAFTASTDLSEGNYSVWVRAFNSAGPSTWSIPATFYVGPMETIPEAPLNVIATDATTPRPTIHWDAVDDAMSYGIWFVNLAGGIVSGQSGLTGLSFTPDSDLSPGNYRAWIRSFNSAGVSGWSTPVDLEILGVAGADSLSLGAAMISDLAFVPLSEASLTEENSVSLESRSGNRRQRMPSLAIRDSLESVPQTERVPRRDASGERLISTRQRDTSRVDQEETPSKPVQQARYVIDPHHHLDRMFSQGAVDGAAWIEAIADL